MKKLILTLSVLTSLSFGVSANTIPAVTEDNFHILVRCEYAARISNISEFGVLSDRRKAFMDALDDDKRKEFVRVFDFNAGIVEGYIAYNLPIGGASQRTMGFSYFEAYCSDYKLIK